MVDRRSGGQADDPRVDELLAGMTLEEKVGQLTQLFCFRLPGAATGPDAPPDGVGAALARGGAGSLLFVTDPAEINRLQRRAVDGSRHGVPALFGFDVIHGLRTILPVPIAAAATWDPALIERGQAVAAREARAVGIHWSFAPMVDIARDPRWGRIVEGAGEDPWLGSAVAAAQVRGFQGSGPGDADRILAGPKHLAGYGAALGGRDYDEVELSDSQLWNVVLPPFEAAIRAGAATVMSAYMPLNGVPATGDRWLLTEVLRDAWDFDGFVVSDANAVRNLVTHGFAADPADAAARALGAGVDMEMAVADPAFDGLADAVRAGLVDAGLVDASARRVLAAKAALGLLDDPFVDEDRARAVLADPAHREVARLAAERSAVLLRNEGDLLPLGPEVTSVAVLGPLADSRRDTLGPWVFDFDLDETVTVLEGLRSAAGPALAVRYGRGIPVDHRAYPSMFDMFPGNRPEDPEGFDADAEFERAIALATGADVAVVVVGEYQDMVGEGASRSSLDLPGRQLDLLQAVVATGTPTVLLVMSGRPLDLRWAAEHVPAILQVWYPGTRGGQAVAALLLGEASPSGRLPFTWPRSVGQVPTIAAHARSHEPENQGRRYWDEASTPLYPFGFGLTYGRIAYRDIAVDADRVPVDGTVSVSVVVANEGARAAAEVVQLYLHQRHGSAVRPGRELKGFQRVELRPGESRTVRFAVGPAERRFWSAAVRGPVLEASTFDVWIGGDATAELGTSFRTG